MPVPLVVTERLKDTSRERLKGYQLQHGGVVFIPEGFSLSERASWRINWRWIKF